MPAKVERSKQLRLLDHAQVTAWVAGFGDCSRLWVDYGFAYDGFVAFCRFVEQRAKKSPLSETLKSVYVSAIAPSRYGASYFPFDIRAARDVRTFTCGLYCFVPKDDVESLRETRRALAECHEAAVELRGRPYQYGFYEEPSGRERPELMWRDEFLTLRNALDPAKACRNATASRLWGYD